MGDRVRKSAPRDRRQRGARSDERRRARVRRLLILPGGERFEPRSAPPHY